MSDTEQSILARAQQGDTEAFGELVRRYQADLLSLAVNLCGVRTEAEDITADAFVRAFRGLRDFRGDCSLKTWLWRILVNCARSHLRRRALQRAAFFWRSRPLDDDEDDREPQWPDRDPGADPERQAERDGIRRIVRRALRALSPREREVFVMKYEKHLKIAEIAATLSLSPNTVKVLLFRGTRKIAATLKDYRKM